MSDKPESAPVAASAAPPTDDDNTKKEATSAAPVEDSKAEGPKAAAHAAKECSKEAVKPTDPELAKEAAAKPEHESPEQPTDTKSAKTEEDADVEMKDAPAFDAPAEGASNGNKPGESETAAPATATPKTKAPARRKSMGTSEKSKNLNKKASKAQITHVDAKPGDHYFIKLKGFPQWPCIICDEDMLPHALLKSRPVSAARADGGYREDFADGGKNVAGRTFPIMYLATNEFGWVSNKDLIDLDPATVMEHTNAKTKKDLLLAHELAEMKHDLDYYKGVLQQFQEELLEKRQAAEAKAAAASLKASKKKGKSAADEDIEMEDVDDEAAVKKDKKRKNPDDSETPQRAESVKKPKIKLTHNSTPKSNGASSKAAKSGGDAKGSSKKAKKPNEESEERVPTPAAPELSAGEKYDRKKKEVLFLRHKLQKGLLTRDQQPKEDEMEMMSGYLLKLEEFPDLETDIIRTTKINKVLKAMLKLDNIPKEEEFEFKSRSQVLLEKWNRLLATDVVPASPPLATHSKSTDVPKAETNGVKKADTEDVEEAKVEKEGDESKAASKKESSPSEAKVTAKMEEASISDKKPKQEEASADEKPQVDTDSNTSEAVEAAA